MTYHLLPIPALFCAGIRLNAEKGGRRTVFRNGEGLVVARVYETSAGKIYARIDFEYLKTP